jgi:hypothetical protein
MSTASVQTPNGYDMTSNTLQISIGNRRLGGEHENAVSSCADARASGGQPILGGEIAKSFDVFPLRRHCDTRCDQACRFAFYLLPHAHLPFGAQSRDVETDPAAGRGRSRVAEVLSNVVDGPS